MSLSITNQTLIKGASPLATEVVFRSLKRYFKHSRWLGTKNRYQINCVELIKNDINKNILNQKHLQEYIAASSILHCYDGWSFLSRAIDCVYSGDSDTVRHLGYYAELRAAMSLLAVGSIGVFNDRHFVSEPSKVCVEIKNGGRTHSFAWDSINLWSENKHFVQILCDAIIPYNGIPLKDWIDAFSTTVGTITAIGKQWLDSWGLDLKRLGQSDQSARNKSSYRPTHIYHREKINANDSLSFLNDFWSCVEPSPDSRFMTIDRYLLRISLEQANKALGATKRSFEKNIINMLHKLFSNSMIIEEWKEFLLRRKDPSDPQILSFAKSIDSDINPKHHLQVISRAILLLRLATGANWLLLKKTGIGKMELEFWWKSVGQENGLWDTEPPDNFLDLWADIDDLLTLLKEKKSIIKNIDFSYFKWKNDIIDSLKSIGSCERVALWGLGL